MPAKKRAVKKARAAASRATRQQGPQKQVSRKSAEAVKKSSAKAVKAPARRSQMPDIDHGVKVD